MYNYLDSYRFFRQTNTATTARKTITATAIIVATTSICNPPTVSTLFPVTPGSSNSTFSVGSVILSDSLGYGTGFSEDDLVVGLVNEFEDRTLVGWALDGAEKVICVGLADGPEDIIFVGGMDGAEDVTCVGLEVIVEGAGAENKKKIKIDVLVQGKYILSFQAIWTSQLTNDIKYHRVHAFKL